MFWVIFEVYSYVLTLSKYLSGSLVLMWLQFYRRVGSLKSKCLLLNWQLWPSYRRIVCVAVDVFCTISGNGRKCFQHCNAMILSALDELVMPEHHYIADRTEWTLHFSLPNNTHTHTPTPTVLPQLAVLSDIHSRQLSLLWYVQYRPIKDRLANTVLLICLWSYAHSPASE